MMITTLRIATATSPRITKMKTAVAGVVGAIVAGTIVAETTEAETTTRTAGL
jgi:hypothetical protein